MTDLLERASGSGTSSGLARCVGDVDAFLDHTWGRCAAVHTSLDPEGFSDLLTLADVDRVLSTTSLRTPAFRMVRGGDPLPPSAYTKSGRTGSQPLTGIADPPRMFELFRQGATIVLQGVHRFWAPVARLCRDLELELGHPCQANAYVTPAGAQGLALHADAHDVLVLQAFGRKHWEVHAAPTEPARDAIRANVGPGDAIYMPLGTPHAAQTEEVISGHLTVGIRTTTWREVLETVWRQMAADPAFDERLAAGHHLDPETLADAIGERLGSLGRRLREMDAGEIARDRIDRFLSTRAPLVDGSLVDGVRSDQMDDATVVRRRRGSVCELRPGEDVLTVLLGDRALRLPARLEPVMRRIVSSPTFAVGRLADLLDEQSRLTLVRRLVREGLLRVEQDA